MDGSANEVWMLGTADGGVSSVGFAPRLAIVVSAKTITTADGTMIDPWIHRVRRLTVAVGGDISFPRGPAPPCSIRIVVSRLPAGNPSTGRSPAPARHAMATRVMQQASADLEGHHRLRTGRMANSDILGHRRTVQLRLCQAAHPLTLVQSATSPV